MDSKLSKLQVRAKVLSFLENGKEVLQNRTLLDSAVEELRQSAQNEDLLEILLKEFSNDDNQQYELLSYLLMEFGSLETLKNPLWDIIKLPKYKDNAKEMASLILRDLGEKLDFDEVTQYFNDPDEIVDAHTQKLLETASCNPESQVDLLDFLYALPENDKIVLINSLKGDYDGDYIANIFSPILEANSESEEIQTLIIDILGTTKSVQALAALNLVHQKSHNEKLSRSAKKSLSLLKLSGVDFENCKKYLSKLACSDSEIYKCYVTIPDGLDYQGLIVARQRENGSMQMMAVVVQREEGIVDCFGFNSIELVELEQIISKFTNDDKCYEVPAEYAKFLLEKAYDKSITNDNVISYEYVCWKVLLSDVKNVSIDFHSLKSSSKEEMSEDDYKVLFEANIFDNWFYEDGTKASTIFKDVRDALKLFAGSDFTKAVEKSLTENFSVIFDKEEMDVLSQRLLSVAVILEYQGNKKLKDSLVRLSNDFATDQSSAEPFLTAIMRNTVYQYLLMLKDKIETQGKTKNIFSMKKNKEKDVEFSVQFDVVMNAITQLETDWEIYE